MSALHRKNSRSSATKHRRPSAIRTAASYWNLRPTERAARERALDALGRMRRQHKSLASSAREAATTPKTTLRYVGAAIRRGTSGRFVAAKYDRLFRPLFMQTVDGRINVPLQSSSMASLVGRHYSAMGYFLTTGDPSRVLAFRNKFIEVGGKRLYFLTDLDEIERLGRAGEFSFESLYEH